MKRKRKEEIEKKKTYYIELRKDHKLNFSPQKVVALPTNIDALIICKLKAIKKDRSFYNLGENLKD